jgi:uncharacterized protein YukE
MGGWSSLPACAYDWVGGNFSGLQALQGQCSAVAATLTDADRALSRQVSQVVSAGGWRGSAANAFTSAWEKDSTAGAQLAQAWGEIGAIAENLAVNLATLENALEEAAYQLEKQGVAIDPADGTALPDTTANGLACPSPQVAADNARLAGQYTAYRTEILAAASAVRAQAALSLNAITGSLLPAQPDWGDPVNGLDAVRGLWAMPTTYRREVADDLAAATKKANLTEDAAWQEALARKQVQGSNFRISRQTSENVAEAARERSALQGKLADSPPESALTMGADGDATGLGLAGLAGGAVRAVPFIGAAAGAGITIWQDREQGESWGESVTDGVVSSGAALGTGLGVATVIGAGSVAAVAGGVLVGGALAVGAGDLVHNLFQENWSAQWQAHGVLDGTVDGVANAASETGHQALHVLGDIGSLF